VGVKVITHLGTSIKEINPKQAAHENRIVACLIKRGPLRENGVKLYTGAIQRVGHEIHDAAVNSLLEQGIIRKLTTTRTNSFILELTKSLQEQSKISPQERKHP
jgi:hypothetical protein